MMENKIRVTAAKIIQHLYQTEFAADKIQINKTPENFTGDLTIVVFPFVKISKKSPDITANEIATELMKEIPEIISFNVVKGFLNLVFSDNFWLSDFKTFSADKNFGTLPSNGKKVMVEYCGPNTNKPLHLGHLRNIFLGFSVAEILTAAGNEVVKVNIINDRGIHICKSMLAYQKFGNGETPKSSGIKGDHLVGKYYVKFDAENKKQIEELVNGGMEKETAEKETPMMKEVNEMLVNWERGDKVVHELWSKMNGWVYDGFEQTFKKIGNDFRKNYYESETYLLGKKIVEEGLEKNVFYKKDDGSAWIDLRPDGLDEKIVLRSNGTSVYITQDIGTAQMKFDDFGCVTSIYVVADEQNYHFKVLKLICQKLKKVFADGIYHLNYGMVDLPTGKMKSREGTVVDADDLIQEMNEEAERTTRALGKTENFSDEELKNLFHTLGMGALKYFIMKVEPKKRMVFDPKESIDFHGNTGPFIQYTHARICSVLRKFASMNPNANANFSIEKLDVIEKNLIQQLSRYPAAVKEASEKYEPSTIANYVYELAKLFNHFYAELPILKCEDGNHQALRVALCETTAATISKAMKLLGITVPERM